MVGIIFLYLHQIRILCYNLHNNYILIGKSYIDGRRSNMDFKVIIIFSLFIILIGLQQTLNKILIELREIKQILQRKQ